MLGDKLKKYRLENGYTQEEVAVHLSVVRQTVSKWEKGVSVPDADLLVLLAQLYDVNVNQLLGTTIPESETWEEQIAKELAKVNEQLALRNRHSKILSEIALVIGVLIFVWGIAGGTFAVINYEGVIKAGNYDTELEIQLLSGCMQLFRKAVFRVLISMVIAAAGGWKCFRMRK